MASKLFSGIDTVILRVSDLHKSKMWYTQTLGFNVIYEDVKLKLVVLDTGSTVSITLWETSEKNLVNPQTASYPIFRTDNAIMAHQRLKEMKVKVSNITTDQAVTYFSMTDPDGNILEVCQTHK